MKNLIYLPVLFLFLLSCSEVEEKPYPILQSGTVNISPIPRYTFDETMAYLNVTAKTRIVSALDIEGSNDTILVFLDGTNCVIDFDTKKRLLFP